MGTRLREKKMSVLVDLSNVNWESLRYQKTLLLDVRSGFHGAEAEALDGIVHLLDYIQDEAASQLGEAAIFEDMEVTTN